MYETDTTVWWILFDSMMKKLRLNFLEDYFRFVFTEREQLRSFKILSCCCHLLHGLQLIFQHWTIKSNLSALSGLDYNFGLAEQFFLLMWMMKDHTLVYRRYSHSASWLCTLCIWMFYYPIDPTDTSFSQVEAVLWTTWNLFFLLRRRLTYDPFLTPCEGSHF